MRRTDADVKSCFNLENAASASGVQENGVEEEVIGNEELHFCCSPGPRLGLT